MMDPVAIVIGVIAFLIAGLVLLYVVASGATHRHKWTMALRTAQRLLQGRDLQAVQRALASNEAGERLGAVMAIGEDDSREAAELLIATLADSDAEVRGAAAAHLSQHTETHVVTALRRVAAEDEDSSVRVAAIGSLGAIGAPEVVPDLVAITQDGLSAPMLKGATQRNRALAAIDALTEIGDSQAAAALAAAQAAGRGEVGRAAEAALRLLGLTARAERADADAGTLKKLAALHLRRRDDETAARWLKKAAEKEDADAEVFHLLGLLQQRQEHWREAETCYQRAIELDPREPFPYFGLGVIYRSKNQTEKALRSLRTYLELSPSGRRARTAARMIKELQERA